MENFRWIILLLAMIFLFMQIKIWISKDGYQQMNNLQENVKIQNKNNAQLRIRNEKLKVEIQDLKVGIEAIEERARTDLGLIGKDEVMYIIIEPKKK
jgi:cell division protein FtsB